MLFLNWKFASPIIGDMLEQSEEYCNRPIKCKHCEDTISFEEGF